MAEPLPAICPECERGEHVACRDEPGTSAECGCNCGEGRVVAPALQQLDEVTAHRWRREGAFCPRRDGRGRPCQHLLELDRDEDGATSLRCEAHGAVVEVVRVAAA